MDWEDDLIAEANECKNRPRAHARAHEYRDGAEDLAGTIYHCGYWQGMKDVKRGWFWLGVMAGIVFSWVMDWIF